LGPPDRERPDWRWVWQGVRMHGIVHGPRQGTSLASGQAMHVMVLTSRTRDRTRRVAGARRRPAWARSCLFCTVGRRCSPCSSSSASSWSRRRPVAANSRPNCRRLTLGCFKTMQRVETGRGSVRGFCSLGWPVVSQEQSVMMGKKDRVFAPLPAVSLEELVLPDRRRGDCGPRPPDLTSPSRNTCCVRSTGV
jgi:hypothetical protein